MSLEELFIEDASLQLVIAARDLLFPKLMSGEIAV